MQLKTDLKTKLGLSLFSGTILVILLSFARPVSAQERVITAGIQFKPIFSSKFFNNGPEKDIDQNITFTVAPKSGYCVGMVIRRGISNTVSLESGINYVKRNFSLSVNDPDSAFNTSGKFGMVSYEIPLQGLVFIQLSDHIFMDVSLGVSFDFYPSDLKTVGSHYLHYSAKKSWFSPSVLANLGWEYRTPESGYFYIGASYHRPFGNTYSSFIQYQNRNLPYPEGKMDLQGNYLTLDLRYFFHSDPEKRKKNIRKPNRLTK